MSGILKYNLADFPYIAIDVETFGLKWWLPEDGIFGIAISLPNGKDFYYDIRRDDWILEYLRENIPKKIVNHNIKFDLHMLHSVGVKYDPEICDCTMIRACLIDEHLFSYSLDNISKRYLKSEKVDIVNSLHEMFGGRQTKDYQMKNIHKAPIEMVAKYAKQDTRLALRLWEWQESEIKRQGLEKIVAFEKRLFPVVFDMERRGVRVDVEKAEEAVILVTRQIEKAQYELNKIGGFEVNCNAPSDVFRMFNPKKIGDCYFVGDELIPLTSGGKPSFAAPVLNDMQHPGAIAILKTRKLMKCRDTFLKGHVLGHQHNGLLHPNINQTKGEVGGTGTGRFSYAQPALQQIPARDKEVAKVMRPIFIPDMDHYWGCWDYSQFEYRMFSHYVGDENIFDIYSKNPRFDFHQMVADMTGLPRNAPASGGANAKQLNLSMLYDMGEASICRTLNMPLDEEIQSYVDGEGKIVNYQKAGVEAKAFIEKYHEAIPGVRKLAKRVKSVGRARGYVMSIVGRHMRYPGGKDLHKSKAILCQGSSADCIKQKMIEIYDYFKSEEPECRMYLSVHDETNLGIPKKHPKFLKIVRDITHILETYDGINCPIKLKVPIKTDFGLGKNWAQASGKGI